MSRRFAPAAVLLACIAVIVPAEELALSFLPPSWDFGSVPAGGGARVAVAVTNRSADTLTVSFIAMCHCLAVEPDRQAVSPGATVEFRISFSATTDDPEGPVSRQFVISSEAPGQKTLLYEVRGTIVRADRGEIAPLPAGVRRDPGSVFAGGLLDAITPCALTPLLFIAALLVLMERNRREAVLFGSLFSLAALATSPGIGFGLFTALRSAGAFLVIARILRWVLAAVLVFLSALSFRDWIRVRQGGNRGSAWSLPLALKLPIRVDNRAAALPAALALPALGAGILGVAFEFTCSCRAAVPTLAWLARSEPARGIGLMALYGLGFVVPSTAVFAASCAAVSSQRIAGLFRLRPGAVRLGFAVSFLGLAVLVLFS